MIEGMVLSKIKNNCQVSWFKEEFVPGHVVKLDLFGPKVKMSLEQERKSSFPVKEWKRQAGEIT